MNFKALCLFVMFINPFHLYASSAREENDNERAVRQILENPRAWASGRALYLVSRHTLGDLSVDDQAKLVEYKAFFQVAQKMDQMIQEDEKPHVSIHMEAVDLRICVPWCRPTMPTEALVLNRDNLFYCLKELANKLFSTKASYTVRTLYVSWTGDITFGVQRR